MYRNAKRTSQAAKTDAYHSARKPTHKRLSRAAFNILTVPADRKRKRQKKKSPSAKRWYSRIMLNPIVIVLPIVGILWLGWNFYLQTTRDLNVAADNLLSGGSFDSYDTDGVPQGWRISKSGTMSVQTAHPQGYISGLALQLNVSGYENGDTELISPEVPLQQGTKYLFKGFYNSNAQFDLLARFTFADGTSKLQLVRNYPASGKSWTTVSDSFDTSGMNVRSVQFVCRFYGNGATQLDGAYLETNSGVYIPPATPSRMNELKNANVTEVRSGKPLSWFSYHAGGNLSKFALGSGEAGNYLHVAVSNYRNGEAKWQQAPIPAGPLRSYKFGVRYRSNVPVNATVEYVLSNGRRQFDTIATLHPAGEWTDATTQFEAPSGATNMFVSVVLQSDGSCDTTGYSLSDITKPGPLTWQRPLVSLAFDDGDESAGQNGVPLLSRNNFPATFYVNPATIDTKGFMASDQLSALKNSGSEVASHAYDEIDLTTINEKRLTSELTGSQDYLNSNFSQKTTDFSSPFGDVDAQTRPEIAKYYESQRGNENGINTLQNFDPYNLRVLYVGNNTPVATVQSAILQTQSENGWLILVYHQIGAVNTPNQKEGPEANVSLANFTAQIQALNDSGITVKTVSAALHEVEGQ